MSFRRYSAPQPPTVVESIEPPILVENATKKFIDHGKETNKQLLTGLSDMLKKSEGKAVIAGGAILSIVHNEYVKDYDLYVNKSYAKDIIKYLLSDGGRVVSLLNINNTPAYDQSFFRKNKIIGRLLFRTSPTVFSNSNQNYKEIIQIDLIIVRDDTKLIDVVSNFDLTFCEVWYDGINFYANSPSDVRNKRGSLKQDYIESLFSGNTFILRRIRKYRRRGYKITISCKMENFLVQDLKLKKNEIIDGSEQRKEEWAVSFIMKKILIFLKFQYVKENIVDFILDKNTKENLTSLFEKLKVENSLVSIENNRRFVDPLGNTSLYIYLCYLFYNNLSFCILENNENHKGKSRKWFNYLQEFVNNDQNLFSYYAYGELLSELVDQNDSIIYRLIGSYYSDDIHNDGLYSIYMSSEFVKYTQYKPYIQLDPDTRDNIRVIEESGNGDVHLIYACPDGHLHASDNCGVPTTISKCNYPTKEDGVSCPHYVGGLYHMLVPGNYIVKHDGYSPAALYYGYFPVYTYKIYDKMYEQAINAIKKYNDSPSQFLDFRIKDLSLKSENIDENITAKKYTVESSQPRTDNNDVCFACTEIFSKTDQGGYSTNVQGPNELYMLPCGHLIHKECLATARGLNQDNLDDDNNINDEIDVSGRVCPYTTCNRNRFLFGSKQSADLRSAANQTVRKQSADLRSAANQTVRKRSYVAGSIRLNRIRTNKRSKKRSINKYRFGAVNKVGPPTTRNINEKQEEKASPSKPNEKTNKTIKKFTKGYITWHKWQEELKENRKKKELVLNNKKEVVLREIVPLASEIKRR